MRRSARQTSVASAAASTELLAATGGRRGFTILNTDANTLHLLFDDDAAAVDAAQARSIAVESGAYYEDPFGYSGRVLGIWDADGAGHALVTEYL